LTWTCPEQKDFLCILKVNSLYFGVVFRREKFLSLPCLVSSLVYERKLLGFRFFGRGRGLGKGNFFQEDISRTKFSRTSLGQTGSGQA